MKIVVASDSFKGSLSSIEVAQAVQKGIRLVYPDAHVETISVADGGEGTLESIVQACNGEYVLTQASDPLGRSISARYGIVGDTAIIEMAAASGLLLLRPEERNPWYTSSFGTGELIMDAIHRGCRKFLIGIGGSATNDAGMGMLQALGFRFFDENEHEIKDCRGGSLHKIVRIDDTNVPEALRDASFTVACDVDTPFCGPQGAAYVFAPQKGADADMLIQLDNGMESFAKRVAHHYGVNIVSLPGAGAAGGLGGALYAFLHAKLTRGIDMVLDAINFDSILRGADLVITGEGKIDDQTRKGKAITGILMRAKRQAIPVIAIAGRVEDSQHLQQMGLAAVYSIHPENVPLDMAMQRDYAMCNITRTIARILPSFPS